MTYAANGNPIVLVGKLTITNYTGAKEMNTNMWVKFH